MRSSVKAAAMTAATLPLFITACSSASNSTASTASAPTASAPSSPASPASAPASSTGDPLASMSADQIASKANADFKAASSYRISGTISLSGTAETLKITRGVGKCAGMVSVGNQPVTFVVIGSTAWIDAGIGKYVKTATSDSSYKQDFAFCDPGQMASNMFPNIGGLSKGTTGSVNGQRVLRLTYGSLMTIDVSISATPEYVRYVGAQDSAHERLDLSGVNAPVSISPPPASKVLGA